MEDSPDSNDQQFVLTVHLCPSLRQKIDGMHLSKRNSNKVDANNGVTKGDIGSESKDIENKSPVERTLSAKLRVSSGLSQFREVNFSGHVQGSPDDTKKKQYVLGSLGCSDVLNNKSGDGEDAGSVGERTDVEWNNTEVGSKINPYEVEQRDDGIEIDGVGTDKATYVDDKGGFAYGVVAQVVRSRGGGPVRRVAQAPKSLRLKEDIQEVNNLRLSPSRADIGSTCDWPVINSIASSARNINQFSKESRRGEENTVAKKEEKQRLRRLLVYKQDEQQNPFLISKSLPVYSAFQKDASFQTIENMDSSNCIGRLRCSLVSSITINTE